MYFLWDFGNANFQVDFCTFRKKLPDLRKKFSKWNSRNIDERERFLQTFSCQSWWRLGNEGKAEHSLMNCIGCLHRYVEQSLFPVSSKQFSGSKENNPVFIAENVQLALIAETPPVKATQKEAARYAGAIYDKIDPIFQRTLNMPFNQALTKVKKLELQTKNSKNERRKERRDIYRKSKASLEEQWQKTDVLR